MSYIYFNSKTYSTHSIDPIVKQCIEDKNSNKKAEYLACLEQPACKAKIENEQIAMMSIGVFIVFCLCVLFYMLYKITDD